MKNHRERQLLGEVGQSISEIDKQYICWFCNFSLCHGGSSTQRVSQGALPTQHPGWDLLRLHLLCFALQPGRNLLLTCLYGALTSLSAALETNKLQGKKIQAGNELMASSDAESEPPSSLGGL